MFLGIEIGGTKLQLGVGAGDGKRLRALERLDVDPQKGAKGILQQIETSAAVLIGRHDVRRIQIGFGGPVDADQGQVTKSHQIDGWDDFPLTVWCRETFGLPAAIGNDCDTAALAEALFGAGKGCRVVLYVTVGTGIGGGLVVDGRLYGAGRPAAVEIGHLRPGLHADHPEATVESMASGWGIVAAAQARLSGQVSRPLAPLRGHTGSIAPEDVRQRLIEAEQADKEYAADLLERCDGNVQWLTAEMVAQAASDGNEVAGDVIRHACQVLGWAIAQTISLLAPDVVVVGGGVSLMGDHLFFAPLRQETRRYGFPPLAGSYQIVPATLDELVVVQGALALAAQHEAAET